MADGARGEQRYGGLTHDEVADLAPAFVLDALPADDVERVREHLRQCPEAHPELAELGSVVPALARSVEAAQPAADLGARILAAARADRDARVASGELIPAPPPVAPAARTVPPAARRSPWSFLDALRAPRWAGAAIVAVAIVAVLGAWNLQLQAQIGGLAAYRDGVTAVLDAAASPGVQVAVLHGTADGGAASSSGLAAVDPSGRLVVAVRELSQTSGAQVYEAWLIGADGKPVPAGSFAVGATGVGTMSVAVAGAGSHVVVALTREPGPGATAPTLPIVLQGTAGAAG